MVMVAIQARTPADPTAEGMVLTEALAPAHTAGVEGTPHRHTARVAIVPRAADPSADRAAAAAVPTAAVADPTAVEADPTAAAIAKLK